MPGAPARPPVVMPWRRTLAAARRATGGRLCPPGEAPDRVRVIRLSVAPLPLMAGQPIIIEGEWTIHNWSPGNATIPGGPGHTTEATNQQRLSTLRLPLDPVRVEDVGGTEVLRYREADMVMGELYRFRWYGEEFAALRSSDGVEILKFVPDEK